LAYKHLPVLGFVIVSMLLITELEKCLTITKKFAAELTFCDLLKWKKRRSILKARPVFIKHLREKTKKSKNFVTPMFYFYFFLTIHIDLYRPATYHNL